MQFLDEFREPTAAKALLEQIQRVGPKEPVTFMEVCGTHTMAISRFGIRSLLPQEIRLVSGPGCPVCVTPLSYMDQAIELSRRPGTIITTFGDLVKVPGSFSSLEHERAAGADIRVVYSAMDALEISREKQDSEVIFLGVGFETTTPTVAATLLTAQADGRQNFSVLSGHKVMLPPMRALLETPEVDIRGFLCPGHVSAVIGSSAYESLAHDYHTSCVVAGFETLDILEGILHLAIQAKNGEAGVENAYERAVTSGGNRTALDMMDQVFRKVDTEWRGFGTIPNSGLALKEEFSPLDASLRFPVPIPAPREHRDCRCPDILRGMAQPVDCPLFGTACTPDRPAGACMVSSEGTCAAFYRYQRVQGGRV